MDAALRYDPAARGFDLAVLNGDLARETSLTSAVVVSLLSDRLADDGDALINPGDRRGWWADSYAADADLTGSRLWLLARAKMLPGTLLQVQRYCEEALTWLVGDGYASSVSVACSSPRMGWVAAQIAITLTDGGALRLRYEWSDDGQWVLADELKGS